MTRYRLVHTDRRFTWKEKGIRIWMTIRGACSYILEIIAQKYTREFRRVEDPDGDFEDVLMNPVSMYDLKQGNKDG